MEENLLVVDDREDKKIISLLEKEGVVFKQQRLNCFDYIIGDELGIEYKSINDFVGSSYGHLREQIQNMKQNHPLIKNILIVLCGSYDDLFWMRYKASESTYLGMLSSIVSKYQISIIHFKRPTQFVRFLKSCLNKIQNPNFIDVHKLKRLESKDNTPLSIVCSLPNISLLKGRQILSKYDVKFSLLNKETHKKIDLEELKDFKGFGNKIVINLKEYFM